MALVDDIRDEILAVMAANELEFDGAVAKYNFADKLANKMIEAASGGTVAAEDVTYDNLLSGLTATDVQAAIDELAVSWGYWNGNYQHFLETQSGAINAITGASVFTANVLFAFPIIIKQDVTIEQVQIAYSTSVAGNSVYGLYDMQNALPNNLIFQTTPFDNAVTGTQTKILPTPQVIKKGLYFVGYNTSSTPNVYYFPANVVPNVFGASFANVRANPQIRLNGAYTYTGTLPSTFGGSVSRLNGIYVPAVLFKIQ